MPELCDTLPTSAPSCKRISRPKNGKLPTPLVATDSEWDVNIPGMWISTTLAWDNGYVDVYVNDTVPVEIRERLNRKAADLGVQIHYVGRNDQT